MATVSLLVSPIGTALAAPTSPSTSITPAGAAGDPVPVFSPAAVAFWSVLSVAGAAAGAYHGTKRNDSVGWGLWWGLCGGAFPVVVPVIALAQGFGTRSRV